MPACSPDVDRRHVCDSLYAGSVNIGCISLLGWEAFKMRSAIKCLSQPCPLDAAAVYALWLLQAVCRSWYLVLFCTTLHKLILVVKLVFTLGRCKSFQRFLLTSTSLLSQDSTNFFVSTLQVLIVSVRPWRNFRVLAVS